MVRLSLFLPLFLVSSAVAHDPQPRFDPVATMSGEMVNPYGSGFRGRSGQGMFSGIYRPHVIDGPAVFRDSVYPFPPRRTHVGNAIQSLQIFHRRWP